MAGKQWNGQWNTGDIITAERLNLYTNAIESISQYVNNRLNQIAVPLLSGYIKNDTMELTYDEISNEFDNYAPVFIFDGNRMGVVAQIDPEYLEVLVMFFPNDYRKYRAPSSNEFLFPVVETEAG